MAKPQKNPSKNRALSRRPASAGSVRVDESAIIQTLSTRIATLEDAVATLLQRIEQTAPAIIESNTKLAASNEKLAEAMERSRPRSAGEVEEEAWSQHEANAHEAQAATGLSAAELEAQRQKSLEADRAGGV